jgi:hypothetical protein
MIASPREGHLQTGDGVYPLTVSPASARGSVPTSGLGNLVASCADAIR